MGVANETKYKVLVWSECAGQFCKELFSNQKAASVIDSVLIVGETLRVGDYKTLQQIEGSVRLDFESNIAKEKRDMELLVFGGALALGESLVCFSNPDKDVVEISKACGSPVLTWSSVFKVQSKGAKKTVKKVDKNTQEREAIPTKVVEKPASQKAPDKSCDALIEKALKGAPSDLADRMRANGYKELKEAIGNASDMSIGLPFQLQMRFGEEGKKMAGRFTEVYKKMH